jgi:site-specific recombinase XerD
LLEKYRRYLREERGLAEASLRKMLMFVDRFLVEKYPRDHLDFAARAVGDITTFVRRRATELGSVQAKHLVTALRSFFRYLRHCGEIDTDLAAVSLAFRIIRSPQFRSFYQLAALRKSYGAPTGALRADGAITPF